jgi:hypothetical protein
MQLSQQLTVGILLTIPVLYGFGNIYGSYLRKISAEAKKKEGVAAGISSEVSGISNFFCF